MFLTPQEVQELTGRVRHQAQARVLVQMGIEHRIRPDGRPIVLRTHVEDMMGAPAARQPRRTKPDWSALDAAS